jgi:hypothetical protein
MTGPEEYGITAFHIFELCLELLGTLCDSCDCTKLLSAALRNMAEIDYELGAYQDAVAVFG